MIIESPVATKEEIIKNFKKHIVDESPFEKVKGGEGHMRSCWSQVLKFCREPEIIYDLLEISH